MPTAEGEDQADLISKLLGRIDGLERKLAALEVAWTQMSNSAQASASETSSGLAQFLRGIPQDMHAEILSRDQWFNEHGMLMSSARLTPENKHKAYHQYDHLEKSEIALAAASSLYYGDYFEFGASSLATFRNMLTAYDIAGLHKRHESEGRKEARFYAFDVFGEIDIDRMQDLGIESIESYFLHFDNEFNQYDRHVQLLEEHGLYQDQCIFVQGLFEETLSEEFKNNYRNEGREIGFAFIDCNITQSYKLVFEFLFELMSPQGLIYMDEYFQNVDGCPTYFEEFTERLREDRQLGCMYVRNAGAYGALFRLHPLVRDRIHHQYGPLRIGRNKHQGTST